MRLSKFIKITLLLVIFLSIIQSLAFADTPPIQPCSFYGTVKVIGENVITGTPIRAVMSGVVIVEVESMYFEGDSVYALQIPGDLSMEGDLIEFYIGDQQASQTAVWQSSVRNELNLSVGGVIFLPLIVR